MSPQSQRIAIAEACGWTDCHSQVMEPGVWEYDCTGTPPHWSGMRYQRVPDYLNDLNAMRNAEQIITNQFTTHSEQYWRHLWFVKPHPIYATAAQRAEAFLKTLGLWES